MGFYLIGPLVTLIPLGSISSWAFKPYCDDGLLGISPTEASRRSSDDSGWRVSAGFYSCPADLAQWPSVAKGDFTGIISTYWKVDTDSNFQPTKTHLNSLLFIFPPARALENVLTFFNENVEPTFFNQHFPRKVLSTFF
jgi:hypothetical protein